MSDKILQIYCRAECKNRDCYKGKVKLMPMIAAVEGKTFEDCPDCNGEGYTDSAMEFELQPEDGYGSSRMFQHKDKYQLWYDNEKCEWILFGKTKHGDFTDRYYQDNPPIVIDTSDEGVETLKNTTLIESINPTHLEVIELKECPECRGKGINPRANLEECHYSEWRNNKAVYCKDGQVEVVTEKHLFQPDEYDERIINQYLLDTRTPFKELKKGE